MLNVCAITTAPPGRAIQANEKTKARTIYCYRSKLLACYLITILPNIGRGILSAYNTLATQYHRVLLIYSYSQKVKN